MVPGQWGGVLSAVARPLTDTFQHVAVYRSLEHWGVHLLASETPIPEMSPAEFSARLGIRNNAFSRKVRHEDCPQNFESIEGKTGRIIKLMASPELEAFMRADGRLAAGRARQRNIAKETARRLSYGKD